MKPKSKKEIKEFLDKIKGHKPGAKPLQPPAGKLTPKHSSKRIRKQGV